MKRETVSIAVMLMLFVSMFLSLPLVSAAYTVENPFMPLDSDDLEPVCAMKPIYRAQSCYFPDVLATKMKVELLFDTHLLEGDQYGGFSPYSTIDAWPDGNVDLYDATFIIAHHYGAVEGGPNWNYLADIIPDRKIDLYDVTALLNNYGYKGGQYSTDLTNVDVMFIFADESYTWRPVDANGFVDIEEGAVAWKVFKGDVIGALVTFWGPATPPVAYFTTFEFNVPNDGNNEVWYYVLTKLYVPQELAGKNLYFVASADDSVQNVKLNGRLKAGSGSSVNIGLGGLCKGYHLLEFEFVEIWGGGSLNFHVATTAEEYAWLSRLRVYVPNYSDNEYRYTITTHTNFPMSDRYFIRGFADDYIDDIKLAGGWLYQDWQWESDWKTIYAWGDGFNVPCGYLDPPYWRNIELVYGVISGGVLDFQILSFTEQPEKIAKGTPEFWASVMANEPINMEMLYKKLYAGSEWYGEPGLSEKKITVAQELCFARYAYAGGPLLWDAKVRFDVGVGWLDWIIDSETSFGITINLTYLGGVEKPLGSVGISYVDIRVRTPAQALGVLGWEFQDLHGGKSIVNSDFKIATSITVSAVAAYALTFALPVGAVVGIAATGAMVMGIFDYVEDEEEAPFEYDVFNDVLATASIDGMGASEGESVSEVLFIKVKPLQATHCGFVEVLVNGILEGVFVKTYIYFPVYVL